ncbi:MAG: sulfite oxidase [Chloroflexi bacterium]|nr:sulfite oxidase [Chloroflexota bacterium]
MADLVGGESRDTLWRLATECGMSRRRFLSLMVAGGAAAVLAACRDDVPDWPTAGQRARGAVAPLVFKDTSPFFDHGRAGLETRAELLDEWLTPRELFFVRNNSRSVDVAAEDWSLSIEGAVDRPTELTLDDLFSLPTRTLVSYVECAGNQRAMFDLIQGRPAEGTQWGRGAVSNAEWQGVALADVLALAGFSASTAGVLLIGLDTGSPERGFRRFLSVEQALHPDTLLAYAMNGAPLPPDHGYPLRAIVPGWIGASQIKWLSRLVVSETPLWTRNNTTSYVMLGEDYDPEGEAEGTVVTRQSIKSALALPWPARLNRGEHRLHGFAHSPHGSIAQVQWSDDGAQSWRDAQLGQQRDYSWARFDFDWSATPGEHTITTRATDIEGNTQPDQVPFNSKGYLFNQPLPHPITVG